MNDVVACNVLAQPVNQGALAGSGDAISLAFARTVALAFGGNPSALFKPAQRRVDRSWAVAEVTHRRVRKNFAEVVSGLRLLLQQSEECVFEPGGVRHSTSRTIG